MSIALLLILMLPHLVRSQSLDIVLRGKVSDQTGLSLPGAAVTAIDEVTGIMRSAVTDGGGFFVLLALPASTYDIRVDLSGFVPKIVRQ